MSSTNPDEMEGITETGTSVDKGKGKAEVEMATDPQEDDNDSGDSSNDEDDNDAPVEGVGEEEDPLEGLDLSNIVTGKREIKRSSQPPQEELVDDDEDDEDFQPDANPAEQESSEDTRMQED